jgi:hypothetical protein
MTIMKVSAVTPKTVMPRLLTATSDKKRPKRDKYTRTLNVRTYSPRARIGWNVKTRLSGRSCQMPRMGRTERVTILVMTVFVNRQGFTGRPA